MKFFKNLKFKLKTKLYFISIGMVILLSTAVLVQFQKGINDQRNGKIEGFSLYFENFSSTISQLFYSKYNNIQAIARNADLKNMKNTDASTFVMNEFITLFPDMDYMVLVDLNGKVVASSQIDANGKKLTVDFLKEHSFAGDEWFQKTKAGKYTEDINKKIFGAYVSDFHFNSVAEKMYGEKRIGQYYSTLIEDEYGDAIAVLASFVNVRWVENEMVTLHKILADNAMESAEILTMNNTGMPIAFFGKHANDDVAKIVHDYENFNLKKNFYGITGNEVIADLKENKKGTVVAQDFEHGDDRHLFAYGPIKNKRFLEFMGWKIVVGMQPDDAFAEIYQLQKLFYSTLAIAFAICCVVTIFIVGALYKQLLNVIEGLKSSAGRTFEFVSQLNDMSGKVNEMSTAQASAIQETASTLDEVSQMVKMSAANAASSVSTSTTSEQNANNGKVVVQRVVSAMNDIKDSNEEILKTTSEGNQRISEIVRVINEISEKTKVINDIVFQTKLLSFNASVEAARAGEHGKGFAVVAEEVGNLAQMSGKAAEEISSILGESISKVQNIVTDSQSSIEKIMVKSKQKIDEGISIAGECNRSLEDIVEGVKQVAVMSHEISTASREQESGVSNISLAMNQLQDTTNENSNIAFQTLKCSEQLDQETEYLKEVITLLENEVVGGKAHEKKVVNVAPIHKEETKDSNPAKARDKKEVTSKQNSQAPKTNVVQMNKVKQTPVSKPKTTEVKKTDVDIRTAVGGEIPDANDPRFEDV